MYANLFNYQITLFSVADTYDELTISAQKSWTELNPFLLAQIFLLKKVANI